MSGELVTELSLGSARGGQRPKVPVEIEVVRSLTQEDIPALQARLPVASPQQLVKTLRHSHHRLAELIAKGLPGEEISLITGYSPSYISNIKNDPAMRELIVYYDNQKQSIFTDGMERLRVLGIDATEKLAEKLADETVDWSKRELMELVEMAVVKPSTAALQARAPAPSASASLSLEVKFVGTKPKDGQVVEASFTEVGPDVTFR